VPAEVPPDELLTLRAAGQRFGVSTSVLRRLVARGQLAGAHKRPTQSGEEWVVPASSVAALVVEAHGSQAPTSAGATPESRSRSAEGTPAPTPSEEAAAVGAQAPPAAEAVRADPGERPADPAPGRHRRSMRVPLLVIVLGLAILGVIGLAGGRDGDEPPVATSSAELVPGEDAARAEVHEALDAELAAGAPVGVVGDGAEELVGPARPVVELAPGAEPDPEVEVVVVAGALSGDEAAIASIARDQGQLILTLADPYPDVEIWRVDASALAPVPVETVPPGAEDPAPVEAPADADEVPAPAGAPTVGESATSVVVEAGGSFWTVAVDLAGPGAGDQEVHTLWFDLIEANRDVLPEPGNPDLLYVGTVLVIPGS
jgi:hypothetical protein